MLLRAEVTVRVVDWLQLQSQWSLNVIRIQSKTGGILCYHVTGVIVIQVLLCYRCCRVISVIMLQVLACYKCYHVTGVTVSQVLSRYRCSTETWTGSSPGSNWTRPSRTWGWRRRSLNSAASWTRTTRTETGSSIILVIFYFWFFIYFLFLSFN